MLHRPDTLRRMSDCRHTFWLREFTHRLVNLGSQNPTTGSSRWPSAASCDCYSTRSHITVQCARIGLLHRRGQVLWINILKRSDLANLAVIEPHDLAAEALHEGCIMRCNTRTFSRRSSSDTGNDASTEYIKTQDDSRSLSHVGRDIQDGTHLLARSTGRSNP